MNYLPVLILLLVGLVVGGVIVVITTFVNRHFINRKKDTPIECGVPPIGDAKQRFSVRFYLVAILFLLFDVEGIFFFPFAIAYKPYLTQGAFILIEMGIFAAVLLVGYFYILGKGALDWE